MGMFDWLFPKKEQQELPVDGYFKTLTAYAPVYRNWGGKLYESELVRSAIDARARHASKLQVRIRGGESQRKLRTRLALDPNSTQSSCRKRSMRLVWKKAARNISVCLISRS